MSDTPDPADLLETAREVLRGDLLGLLPADARYRALMVANAMAIAARALRGEAAPDAELAPWAADALLARGVDPDGEAAGGWRKALCGAIRAGAFDPDTPAGPELMRHLRRHTRQRLAISNPRALADRTA